MRVLVTGAAGFIGMHTSLRLLERGEEVVGFDDLNAYYDPALKAARLARLQAHPGFTFVKGSLEDRDAVTALFAQHRPQRVVNGRRRDYHDQQGHRRTMGCPEAARPASCRTRPCPPGGR